MKNTIKFLGIIAIVALIGFSMAACAPNNPDPEPEDEDLSGNITISPSGPVSKNTELTATYSGTAYVNYQWNKDGSAISNETYYKYTPTAAGSYTVTVSRDDKSKTSAAVTVTAQTWTEISAFNGVTIFQTFYSLADAKLFAVGTNGKIMTSDDNGDTWTTVTNSTFGTSNIRGIAYGTGIGYVAVGENGKMAYSSKDNKGVTWTAVTDTKLSNYINGIAYSHTHGWTGGNLVAVGSNGGIAYSANGTTWTAVTDSPFTSAINAIAYGDIVKNNIGVDRLVAVGNDGIIAYSDDQGVTWTEVEDSTFGTSDITKIVSNGTDKFIAVGFFGKMATSTDGITWTAVEDSTFGTDNTSAIMAIDYYGGTKFIAGGFSKMATTNDGGATWKAITITTGDILIYSIYGTNNGALLGVSNKMLFVSDLF
jgi:photosystem II stability/assembly factor-like uncharacterized protein